MATPLNSSPPAVEGAHFDDSSRGKDKASSDPSSFVEKCPAAIVKKWKHSQACTKRKASPCNSMMASWRYKSPTKKSKSKTFPPIKPTTTTTIVTGLTVQDLGGKIDVPTARVLGQDNNSSNNVNSFTSSSSSSSSSQQAGDQFSGYPSSSSPLTRLFPLKSHLVTNPIENSSRAPCTFQSSPPSSPPMPGVRLGYPNGNFSAALYESSSSPLSSGPSSPDVSCTAGIPVPNLHHLPNMTLPSASVVASMSQPPSAFAYGPRPASLGGYPLTQMDLYYLWMSVPQELLPYPYQVPHPVVDTFSRQLPCLMPIATTD